MRDRSLDGLRGVAVLSVVVHHYFHAKLLWAGVDLFFILSGYLITSILLRTREESFGPYIGRFYRRRARRILPPYAALLVITALLSGLGWTTHWWLYGGLMNFALPLHLDTPEQLQVLWSLAVEEQFYLVWPLAVFFLSRKHLQRLTIAIVLLVPVARFVCTGYFARHWAIYMLLPFRMDTLASGALAALYWPALKSICKRSALFLPACTGAALAAVGVLALLARHGISTSSNTPLGNLLIYEASLLLTLSLFLVALSGAGTRLFQAAPLVGLGTVSYSIYLIHPTARLLCKNVPGSLLATLLYAVAMWFVVERPLTRPRKLPDAPADSSLVPVPPDRKAA